MNEIIVADTRIIPIAISHMLLGQGKEIIATGVIVTCTRSTPPLQPGETATVTLNALVSAGASAPVLNRAWPKRLG